MSRTGVVSVLICCVGRQVSLVRQFQAVEDTHVRVITVDANPFAAGGAVADVSYVAPAITREGYVDWIVGICKRERIDLVLSLRPDDLMRLEEHRRVFEECGACLVGMPLDTLKRCLDKRQLPELCRSTGFKTAESWLLEEIDELPSQAFPLIAKEAEGTGSIGVRRITDHVAGIRLRHELETSGRHQEFIIQPWLSGEEYGLDLVNDLEGRPATTLIRRKLRMRDGETEIAEMMDDEALASKARALAGQLGHQGLVDCDVMRCEDGDYILDINARFGGGYIFSHYAGANIPAALIAWLQGREVESRWLQPEAGQIAARVTDLQVLNAARRRIAIVTTGGGDIGMGHASRQLTLARRAMRDGDHVVLVTDSGLVAEQAVVDGVAVVRKDIKDPHSLKHALAGVEPDRVIIDVHERDFAACRWVAGRWPTLLMVSRVGHSFEFYGSDVVLIGEDLEYWDVKRVADSRPGGGRIHSGRAFVFFRDEFTDAAASGMEAGDRPRVILVAHGGADPFGLTSRTLRALNRSKGTYEVVVLVGPAFSDVTSIRQLAARSKHRCTLVEGQTRVSPLMAKAAVAVINGGNIRYELCQTGTPYVAISFQQRQYDCSQQLARLGVGVNLGIADKLMDDDIASAVEDLIYDPARRAAMQKRMTSLFDMDGVERVVSILHAPPRQRIELRPLA